MRIRSLTVGAWRNLRELELSVPPDTPLLCLVGENGTGKSAVLELLSACAHQLGISQGVEIHRGNPFAEEHDVALTATLPLGQLPATVELVLQQGYEWDGTLKLTSSHEVGVRVVAVGLPPPLDDQIANTAIGELRARSETQHLFLDSDRAYPPTQFQPQQLVEIWNQDYRAPEFNRQWAHRPTRTLYEEWLKYLVGVEERTGAQLVADIRAARATGDPEPTFVDPFENYRTLLHQTLPHLRFVGIETTGAQRTVKFNSAGLDLVFSALSGGEREIAFLTGQVDRFRLQRGLLLVDEPELHLNPDLLRSWLAFLRDTISDGQVWFATHSLEAVEVAGPDSTFVFERDAETRLVRNPRRLAGRPVLSALSAAIGSPAFSIAKLRFVLIEGDRQTRERERFYAVCGEQDVNRFLEAGGCDEVLRRLQMIRELAGDTNEQLRVGGVIDRDFRSDDEVHHLETGAGIHVLGCHEIENAFLQPEAIAILLERSGKDPLTAVDIIRNESDRFAGLWIADNARKKYEGRIVKEARTVLAGRSYDQLAQDWPTIRTESAATFEATERPVWMAKLDEARAELESLRIQDDWWRHCLGKQTLGSMASAIGLSSSQVLEDHIVKLWESDVAIPGEVLALRGYLNALTDE